MTTCLDNKKYISGGLSGIIEVICTHPLDYIKTKKQEYVQRNLSNGSFYKQLIKEGKFNLYRGVIPRILGVMPMRFVFWGVQDNSYHYLHNKYNRIDNNYQKGVNNLSKFQCGVLAGCIGGSCQTIIDNPIEILKIKMMTNQKFKMKELIQNRGFSATLCRNVGFAICISSLCFGKERRSDLHNFGYSALGGLMGSVLTQPLDYVKTQQQRSGDHRSIFRILIKTFKDSPRKLYVGGFNRSLVSFFSMGIGFVAYDRLYRLFC
tara:strand:+ start:52 stop:840 length:789 start_codon:yes stop_codon:yes gene_type:complete